MIIANRTIWKKLLYVALSSSCLGVIVCFPISFGLLPDLTGWIGGRLEPVIDLVAQNLFGLKKDTYTTNLLSDTTGVYVLAFFSCTVGLLFTIAWWWRLMGKIPFTKWRFWFMQLARYYLVIHLLQFGLNKVFKLQFYFPEPNTLYTTIGNSTKDILFWSTMGSSYEYTVFAGLMEVVAAGLLLFRKTRLVGALLTFGIMLNVVMINFSFDISVKFLSSFLLLLSLLLILPDYPRLLAFFIRSETAHPSTVWSPNFVNSGSMFYGLAKALITILIVLDAFYPYVSTGTYNDDLAPRPFLHGAYETIDFNGELEPWKRVFVHRGGYYIVQQSDESMVDYKLQLDTVFQRINLTKGKEDVATLGYKLNVDTLLLFGRFKGERVDARLRQIDLDGLPIKSEEFAWTIDTHLKYGK